MSFGFQPFGDNLLLRLLPVEPADPADTVTWAVVIAVGPGRRTADGTLFAADLAPGDRIAVRPGTAVPLRLEGQALAVADAGDVLGIVLPETARAPAPPKAPRARRHSGQSAAQKEPPALESPSPETAPAASEESPETDIAPDLLDRAAPTADDLH